MKKLRGERLLDLEVEMGQLIDKGYSLQDMIEVLTEFVVMQKDVLEDDNSMEAARWHLSEAQKSLNIAEDLQPLIERGE
jgi:hypothetical protein